jgi:PAS domain-containing protein
MMEALISIFRSVSRALISRLRPARAGKSCQENPVSDYRDAKDMENVVQTFQQLVAKLSRDGTELGELYARAERRAARFAILSETVVESVSSGILVVEKTGQVGLMNSSARRLLGIDDKAEKIGCRLAELFADGSSLESIVGECFRSGETSSRNVISIVTLDGRCRQFGASISCLKSGSRSAEAVIIVFTELGTTAAGKPMVGKDERSEIEHHSYLRGVLDAYDMLSTVLATVDGLQARARQGRLTVNELQQFSGELGRACELMMAFAVSHRACGALTELVDVNTVIESTLKRKNLHSAPHITRNLHAGLPRVKTVGKVLEMGLEMLVLGCVEASPGGIDIVTGQWRESGVDLVGISVREKSMTRPLLDIGDSLRDFIGETALHREAGLLLLRALPSDSHRIKAEKRGDFLTFSIGIAVPIGNKARPSTQGGEISERG